MMLRPRVSDLNAHLVCVLCSGYLVDATTIVECLHTFCRSCIVRFLESSKFCPMCDVQVHKSKPLVNLRSDKTIQNLVYKAVPGMYAAEMKRRREYYSNLAVKGVESAQVSNPEGRGEPETPEFFSPEDSISLSLEYYSGDDSCEDGDNGTVERAESVGGVSEDSTEQDKEKQDSISDQNNKKPERPPAHKRYLQCPAAVSMRHLKKFIRLKYGLSPEYKVDIIYQGECLREDFTLMDVAYTFNWKRNTSLRFSYRIYERLRPATTVGVARSDRTISDRGDQGEEPPAKRSRPFAPESDNSKGGSNNNNNNAPTFPAAALGGYKPQQRTTGTSPERPSPVKESPTPIPAVQAKEDKVKARVEGHKPSPGRPKTPKEKKKETLSLQAPKPIMPGQKPPSQTALMLQQRIMQQRQLQLQAQQKLKAQQQHKSSGPQHRLQSPHQVPSKRPAQAQSKSSQPHPKSFQPQVSKGHQPPNRSLDNQTKSPHPQSKPPQHGGNKPSPRPLGASPATGSHPHPSPKPTPPPTCKPSVAPSTPKPTPSTAPKSHLAPMKTSSTSTSTKHSTSGPSTPSISHTPTPKPSTPSEAPRRDLGSNLIDKDKMRPVVLLERQQQTKKVTEVKSTPPSTSSTSTSFTAAASSAPRDKSPPTEKPKTTPPATTLAVAPGNTITKLKVVKRPAGSPAGNPPVAKKVASEVPKPAPPLEIPPPSVQEQARHDDFGALDLSGKSSRKSDSPCSSHSSGAASPPAPSPTESRTSPAPKSAPPPRTNAPSKSGKTSNPQTSIMSIAQTLVNRQLSNLAFGNDGSRSPSSPHSQGSSSPSSQASSGAGAGLNFRNLMTLSDTAVQISNQQQGPAHKKPPLIPHPQPRMRLPLPSSGQGPPPRPSGGVKAGNGIAPTGNITSSTLGSQKTLLPVSTPPIRVPSVPSVLGKSISPPPHKPDPLLSPTRAPRLNDLFGQHPPTKPGPNQAVRHIPNPSALLFRQQANRMGPVPPPPPPRKDEITITPALNPNASPLSSIRKIENLTRNIGEGKSVAALGSGLGPAETSQ